jgi:ATP-dependent DNA helicase RecQ
MTDAERTADVKNPLREALRSVFGFDAFRPHQEEIVRAILDGRDVFAVMPTGGGKSLCYQLPACLRRGTGVVISPLISLMKDQVDAARNNGFQAEYLNSSIPPEQRSAIARRLVRNELDLIYVAPERFTMSGFLEMLADVEVCLFAIDEAHCVSEWGHDFRPDYLGLSIIPERFPGVPVAAFTATATERVQQDIADRLGLRQPTPCGPRSTGPTSSTRWCPKSSSAANFWSS